MKRKAAKADNASHNHALQGSEPARYGPTTTCSPTTPSTTSSTTTSTSQDGKLSHLSRIICVKQSRAKQSRAKQSRVMHACCAQCGRLASGLPTAHRGMHVCPCCDVHVLLFFVFLVLQGWPKPSRRDLIAAGVGSLIGGAAMYIYDTRKAMEWEWKTTDGQSLFLSMLAETVSSSAVQK